MADHGITPSQTAGPYFAYALTPGTTYNYPALVENDLTTPDAVGDAIVLTGRLFDGSGKPVPDAFLELWQADGAGRYSSGAQRQNTSFKGFGRAPTTTEGAFTFRTVKPGAVDAPGGGKQAPHINVSIFARGILKRIFTRVYFADEAANASDPILALVPAERRGTLLARRDGDAGGVPRYVLDIHLQGDNETVFFEA